MHNFHIIIAALLMMCLTNYGFKNV